MTELDKIRADIEQRLENAHGRMRAAEVDHDLAFAELAAHDRAVAAMGAPAADSPPTRHSIQRPVMALFHDDIGWKAETVVEKTGLPETGVSKFLGRAVKSGLLVRHGEIYRLPPEKLGEAAQ